MTAKLDHYTPKFYLKPFAAIEDPKTIWVYDKAATADNPRRQGLKGTGAETHFYSMEGPSGEKDDWFEQKVLSPLESNAAPILRRLLAGTEPSLSPGDAESLGPFLAMFWCRSPRQRAAFNEITAVVSRQHIRKIQDSPGLLDQILREHPEFAAKRSDMEEALRAGQDPKRMAIGLRKNSLLGTILLLFRDCLRYFRARKWSLLRAPDQVDFITSDSPLSVFKLSADGRALIGVGVGLRAAEITLTISPRLAIRLSAERSAPLRLISGGEARDVNRRLIAQAHRYVFACRSAKSIQAEIALWGLSREGPMFDPEELIRGSKAVP